MLTIEAKRLTQSDLKFFKWHKENPTVWKAGTGGQKALNPKKEIVDQHRTGAWPGGEVQLAATIYGPGLAGPDAATVNLTPSGKNWRINGQQPNPAATPKRYDVLRPGDWVVIALEGATKPTAVRLVFLRNTPAFDKKLVTQLSKGASGRQLSFAALDEIVNNAKPAPTHGIHTLLADAVTASAEPPPLPGTRLIDSPVWAGTTKKDFIASAKRQRAAGDLGEKAVAAYLAKELASAKILDYRWHSTLRADASWDFEIDLPAGMARIDVKATQGAFGSRFYLSNGEIRAMLKPEPYLVYRVFDLDPDTRTAKLRRSEDLTEFAKQARKAIRKLPLGLDPITLKLTPGFPGIKWGPTIKLKF